jgi:DNA-binding response OmpR family regulator
LSSSLAIMVVEDDILIALDVQMMLQAEGYLVLGPVTSVKAALAKVEEQRPDAAILDVNLGREMAFPVADALVAAAVPFVWLTGHSPGLVPARHRHRPILNKPFRERELLDVLGRVMAG